MVAKTTYELPGVGAAERVRVHVWQPQGAPRGVVQIVHGISEHMGRYGSFAAELAHRGFRVVGEDHPGHGQTKGPRGYFGPEDGWGAVTELVAQVRRREGEMFPHIPYVFLGHSMGSFLVRSCLIRYPGAADGAILSGTGQVGDKTLAVAEALARWQCRVLGPQCHSPLLERLSMGRYNRAFHPARTPADWISSDSAQVDAYLADPLCGGLPSAGLMGDLFRGMREIGRRENLAKMDKTTPVLLVSGERDPVGDFSRGVRWVYRAFLRAGCTDVTLKLYPGCRHELLHEGCRQQVAADLLAWLEGCVGEVPH